MDHQRLNEAALSPEQALDQVYRALVEKGYDPPMQIVGYLLTEDPTYITNYQGARALIARIDRDELLKEIVKFYFETKHQHTSKEQYH